MGRCGSWGRAAATWLALGSQRLAELWTYCRIEPEVSLAHGILDPNLPTSQPPNLPDPDSDSDSEQRRKIALGAAWEGCCGRDAFIKLA